MELMLLSMLSFMGVRPNPLNTCSRKVEFLETQLLRGIFAVLNLEELVLRHCLSLKHYRSRLRILTILWLKLLPLISLKLERSRLSKLLLFVRSCIGPIKNLFVKTSCLELMRILFLLKIFNQSLFCKLGVGV